MITLVLYQDVSMLTAWNYAICCLCKAIEVMQKSVEALVAGFNGHLPDLNMTTITIVVLCVAICVKLALWYICSRIATNSPSADALAQVSARRRGGALLSSNFQLYRQKADGAVVCIDRTIATTCSATSWPS